MPVRRRSLALALAALPLLPLGACRRPEARPVRIVLSLHGAAGRPVHGIDLTVALPAGAQAEHDPATMRLSSAALRLRAGAPAAALDGRFAPHATAPSVRILLAAKAPMRDGEVAAVDVVVTSAVAPALGSFEVVRAAIAGADGASVDGATGWVSAIEPR